MSLHMDERPQPATPAPKARKSKRRTFRKIAPFLFVLLAIALLAYPVLATQHNNNRQDKLAENYHSYTSNLSEEQRQKILADAREYNRPHPRSVAGARSQRQCPLQGLPQ